MRFFSYLLISLAVVSDSCPAWAAGAYVVDDANIVDTGKIQNESWYTHGGHVTDIGNINLAYQFLPNTEFTLQETHAFIPGGGDNVSPQVKYQWYKSEKNKLLISPVAGFGFTTFQSRTLSPYAYIPLTYEVIPKLELDANFGWQYDNGLKRNFVTWGFRENYEITKTVSFTSDIFGRNDDLPGFQLGPHFTVNDNLEFDLVYGRNVYGSEENSGTVGMTLTF